MLIRQFLIEVLEIQFSDDFGETSHIRSPNFTLKTLTNLFINYKLWHLKRKVFYCKILMLRYLALAVETGKE